MLQRLFPLAGQLATYDKTKFSGDLSAGLTVGVMLIPQGMAYALIAGMPPIYGLYASLVPLVIYALMGTSRQLSVGPVAMVSLLVAAGVGPLANGDPDRYIQLALLLALMVGVLQLAMGLFRFGFLTNFLSHPVLAGFTSAAALIIGASQLKHLLGVNLPGSKNIFVIAGAAISQAHEIHLLTLGIGLAGIAGLIGFKRINKRFPGALVVVAIGTLATALLGLTEQGVKIVGDVPGGFPALWMPEMHTNDLMGLLPVALTISLVGFMESIAVAKVYALKHKYDVDPNRELIGLGLANLIGSFFRSFPVTGGFSRTAVNDQAGSQTTLATLISAGIIGITLLFFTGLFTNLPNAILAAIVMVAVASLVDVKGAKHLWHTDRLDFSLMAITFAATLGLGIEEGIVAGVIVSLGALVYGVSRPHTAVLGRLPDSTTYRNVNRFPEAEREPGVVVYRIDATLCFANAEFVRDEVRGLITPETRALVFDFHAINGMDSTAMHQFSDIVHELRAMKVETYFAGVKGPVLDRMKRAHLYEDIGAHHFHFQVYQAVEAACGTRLAKPAVSSRPEELLAV